MPSYSWTVDSTAVAVPTAPAAVEQAQLLGKDIYFDGDRRVTPHGDFLLVDGLNALRQWVYHCLMTNPGEYRLRPEYGCGARAFLAKRNVPGEVDEFKNRIRENLLRNPQIDEVAIAVADLASGDGVQVAVAITARGQALRPFSFDLPEGT